MRKDEIAAYLVSLHTLVNAQSASVHNPSAMLTAEYDKYWAMLKDIIQQEDEDEARKR